MDELHAYTAQSSHGFEGQAAQCVTRLWSKLDYGGLCFHPATKNSLGLNALTCCFPFQYSPQKEKCYPQSYCLSFFFFFVSGCLQC